MSDFWQQIGRTTAGRCPNCGTGKLFSRYLKQVDYCADCDAPLGQIRADDGPAWLTIILVGHILAPVLLLVVPGSLWPEWVSALVWCSLALVMTLLLLPRAKGLFIGVLWRMQK